MAAACEAARAAHARVVGAPVGPGVGVEAQPGEQVHELRLLERGLGQSDRVRVGGDAAFLALQDARRDTFASRRGVRLRCDD